MFPTVSEPFERYIAKTHVRQKQPRKRWHPQSKLLIVEPPQMNTSQNHAQSRKYCSIRFKYEDGLTKKIKTKTVYFGDKDGQFVGDNDQNKRTKRYIRLTHQHDPFHPNYWRLQILNTQPTIQQAYLNFVRKVVNMQKQIQHKK